MPGTIQVSVLGLLDVQTTSQDSSNTSIKVSMGKLEFQTFDSGDYIFPVTKLRENLIVTLLDVNGNGLLHREIETRMIIESGFLEEKLSFNGYGNVKLIMRFVLSEEDRNRIRFLRQSALRKKHEELVNTEFLTKSKSIASDLSSLSPMRTRDTAVAASSDSNLVLSQETELKTDEGREPVSSNLIMWKPEKTKSQVSSTDASSSKKLLDVKKPESGSGLNKVERNPKRKSMRRSMSETNLNNVRKMISTFEVNVTQDTKTRTTKIQTKAKSQPVSSVNVEKPKERMISSVCIEKSVPRDITERCNDSVIEEKSLEESNRRSDSLSKERRKRSSVVEVKDDEKKPNKYLRWNDSQLENARGSRLWIFPDEAKDLTNEINLKTEHLDSIEPSFIQKKTKENIGERGFRQTTIAKMNRNNKWKNIEQSKKHMSENPADSESSRGPVGQVMRALIVVCFAGLVLLTRQ